MATKRVSEKNVVMSTSAAAAPVRRKSPTSKRANRTASIVEESNTPEVVSAESVIEITNDTVAQLAYSYWVGRGCQGGSPEEDWLRAEQELRAVTSK